MASAQARWLALARQRGFWPLVIVLLALAPRLVFWAISEHPGLWDPSEYYNLALSLHEGRGFTLDYIWSFANDPAAVTHPLDHWLPLPGVLAAGGFALFGVSVQAALLPFVLLGALQSLLAYGFALRIGAGRAVAVFAALATAWTPWLFLSSLHTDTTTPFGVWAFGALAAVYLGVHEDGRWLWAAGALGGLAMLTRNDGPALIAAGALGGLWLAWRRGTYPRPRHVPRASRWRSYCCPGWRAICPNWAPSGRAAQQTPSSSPSTRISTPTPKRSACKPIWIRGRESSWARSPLSWRPASS